MKEGLDKDDKYRMVEDEFLDAAKQFTQHLHAAEYLRLKKAARSQNAATINSISRPVTAKMPDETRRKVESIAKARKQATTLQGLLSNQGQASGSDEDFDGHGSAWLGTALHGLMENPRKTATSLTRVAEITATTRATTGFRKPRRQKSINHSPSPQPALERYIPFEKETIHQAEATCDASDYDDDDLDAPIRPRVVLDYKKAKSFTTRSKNSALLQDSKTSQSAFTDGLVKANPSHVAESYDEDMSSRTSINARERIAKRLEQAKLGEVKQQQEARKRLEIIPMFLS